MMMLKLILILIFVQLCFDIFIRVSICNYFDFCIDIFICILLYWFWLAFVMIVPAKYGE